MFAKFIEPAWQYAFSDEDNGGVEITEAEYVALYAAERSGLVLQPGTDGRPVAVERTYTAEQLAAQVRAQRDAKLTACEWMATRHRDQIDAGAATTLTAAQYQELLTYRPALRDITAQAGFPVDVTWSSAPGFVE